MADKKKTGNKKKVEEKKIDKKIIIIAAIAILVVAVAVAVVLAVSGRDSGDTETTTAGVITTDAQQAADEALWAEHNALFEELNNVYYRGIFDNYKTLIPPEAWEAMAAEEEMTVEELYAKAERDLATMDIPEDTEYNFYIAETTKLTGKDFDEVAGSFAEVYNMDVASFEEIYLLDVQVVITKNGERETIEAQYYSIKLDGVRYLATDTGFVG